MDDDVRQFETNPTAASHEARDQDAAAFVVAEAPVATGTKFILVCKLRNHDADSTGTTRIPVLSSVGHAVGEFLYAIRPAGGTEAMWTENTSRVEWVEIGGGGGALPIGEYEGQLWGNISDNATGFKFPSLHAIPPE